MKDYNDVISTVLGTIGISVSVQDIHETLSIILIIISIVNILWGCGWRIYKHVKNKEYDQIDDEIEKATNELDELNKKGK